MPIVEAVGAAAGSIHPSGKLLAKAIELAMSDAVLDCNAKGITDPAVIRAAMQKAREAVKARWNSAVNEASAAMSRGEE